MGFIEILTGGYTELVDLMPTELKILPPLFFISMAIVAYSLFIWFFHKFLAQKDLLKLNLHKYDRDEYEEEEKTLAILLYILEFIIITPVLIFIWFTIFTLFLIIFAKELEVGTVMLIGAALISAVRITAYFNEDLAKEIGKLFPLTFLATILTTSGFFDISTTIDRISQLPLFFDQIFYYLLFIFIWEIVLRVLHLFFFAMGVGQKESKEPKPISSY